MFTMALVGRAVTTWAGASDAVVEFAVRFSRPVPVPDTDEGTEVVVSGVIKDVTDDGLTRITLTATCQGEKVLSLASATIRKR
jgi:acyl dehydratase